MNALPGTNVEVTNVEVETPAAEYSGAEAAVQTPRSLRGDALALARSALLWARRHASVELWAALATTGFVTAVTLYRLGAIRQARHAGVPDAAFYYGVAQNIHDGRGAQINYIWEFLTGQPPLPRYAFDYWMPLPSALMSVALHLRDSLPAALSVNVGMSVLMAIGTYLLCRSLGGRSWAPAAAAAVLIVQPSVSIYSVDAEAPLYLAAFALLSMVAAVGARRRPWLWPIAGALAGLANLSRSEGLLLIVVLAIAVPIWSRRGRRLLFTGAMLAGYLVVMTPLIVMNMHYLGRPITPATSALPFITTYFNLYSVHVNHSLSNFIGGSWHAFVHGRVTAIGSQVQWTFGQLSAVDIALIAVLIGVALQQVIARHVANTGRGPRWTVAFTSAWFLPVAYVAAVFASEALLTPVASSGGAGAKAAVSAVPILCIAAMIGLSRVGLGRVLPAVVVAVLLIFPLITLSGTTRKLIAGDNAWDDRYAALIPSLRAEQACIGKPVVVMTTSTWNVTEVTGFRSVAIPNDSLADVLAVARRYQVTDIEMSSKRVALAHWSSLVQRPDGPFTKSRFLSGAQIYRIKSQTGTAVC